MQTPPPAGIPDPHPADPAPAPLDAELQTGLDDLAAQGMLRRLRRIDRIRGTRTQVDGRTICCFCSNNYLGLAGHPAVLSAARQALEQWGWGAGASRLVCGNTALHEALEQRLAAFKKAEAALVFPSGYQANLAAVRGLVTRGDVILLDKLNHASIIDAARSSQADIRVFGHRDYDRLEALLKRYAAARRRLIVTESVFSMDGDTADLARLVDIKRRYRALLCVDEAHATGVLGPDGRGLAAQAGVEDHVDVSVGTLSKALGGVGGFVAASRPIIDWLINTAGPFIYSTAMPPAACAAALAALEVMAAEPWRREKLLRLARQLRRQLRERLGIEPGAAATGMRHFGGSPRDSEASGPAAGLETPIVPVIVGLPQDAVALSASLEEQGFLVPAIRPPTVPRGTARLRICVSADHREEDITALTEALGRGLDNIKSYKSKF